MDSGDWSYQKAALQDRIHDVANQLILPSVLYRADVCKDGDQWSCLYGDVVAYGETPAEAVNNFDYYVWHGKPVPEKKP